MNKQILTSVLIALTTIFHAQAQLAVTEVMTGEAKNYPDWWELHNYGTNDIDLTGYSWNDDAHGGFSGADATPFDGVIIRSNETVIFTEPATDVATPDDFRTWWGIGTNIQVIMLNAADPGLSKSGDDVRFWSTNLVALGSNTNGLDLDECSDYLVQQLNTGTTSTQSLLYDPVNGVYDILSTNGVNGAFAASTGDIGSPGIAPDAVLATITQIPADTTVTIGSMATFTNAGLGLPPLVFHWYLNNSLITSQTPGVLIVCTNNTSVLTLNGAQTASAGNYTYSVIADNGLQSFTNSTTLTVSAVPTAPTVLSAPLDSFDAYVGQTVPLTVTADGYPAPTYQWYSNNVELAGETSNVLMLALTDTNQSATYSVIVTNSVGGTNVSIALNVTPFPNPVITGVESSEGTNTDNGDPSGHGDWFELSNLTNFPVNLYGYRIDDSHDSLSLSAMITNRAIIHPGESVVFVQDMTPDEFRTWWGTNLSPNVQIIDYNGSGQGLSAGGDGIFVWNAAAMTEADYVTAVTFGTATEGVSFGFDLSYLDQSGFDGFTLSTAGVDGAFVAAVGGDIGSPGAIINMPRFTSVMPTAGGFTLSWFSQPNWNYIIQYKTNLTDAAWTTLAEVMSSDTNVMNYTDSTSANQRFYRVFLNLNNQ